MAVLRTIGRNAARLWRLDIHFYVARPPVRGTVVKLVGAGFQSFDIGVGSSADNIRYCPVDEPWYLPGLLRSITHIEPPLSATTARKG
jgi:hypothetical protein